MNPLVTTGLPASHEGTALSVNVNLVAQIRNRRDNGIPSVVGMARLALESGAQGITIHPRPDERHIRGSDARELAVLMRDWPQAEFNIEGNPFHNLMPIVRELRPAQCTFVPDSEGQSTSDHGWSLPQDAGRLRPVIEEAQALGVRVSLFMDPLPEAMREVRGLGAERVELYTESFARAFGTPDEARVLAAFRATAEAALREGLALNAGHDLNQANLAAFLRAVPGIREVSIGHALISEAIEQGLAETVRRYLNCILQAA